MKTDDLITMLATGSVAIDAGTGNRRLGMALGWSLAGTVLLMALLLGVRADLAQAARLPMFWAKLLTPAVAAITSLRLVRRLATPGRRSGAAPAILAALVLVTWAGAGAALLSASSEARPALVFGYTWKTCALNIGMLSLPILGAMFWAVKGLAPTRPLLAGASIGLLAGAAAAAVYALHCPEMAAPFLGIWYVLGIAIPSVAGGLLGLRLLRW